jgi:hypothetical protein
MYFLHILSYSVQVSLATLRHCSCIMIHMAQFLEFIDTALVSYEEVSYRPHRTI